MNIVFENLGLKKCNQLLSNVEFYEKQIEALEMMLEDVMVRFTNNISFDKKIWYTNSFEEKKLAIKLLKEKLEQNKYTLSHSPLSEFNVEENDENESIKKLSIEVYNLEKEINVLSKLLKYFLIDIL
jgi:transcriptional/translational regulatory protein YebC/TACO1